MRRAAEWIVADMQRIGLTRAQIFQKDNYLPLVYGEWLGAGKDAPTVLLYCHYDVQPAALEDGWDTNPFEPVERDGRIYARGSLDSKMHVVGHLKAVESLFATGKPHVNLKLLFEGEEESGSEHIFSFVKANHELLDCDVVVISDGSSFDEHQPVLDYGLRGIISMELRITGPQSDLHSGQFGGTVHNPIQALTEILAQLHDDSGKVTVPGFYDDVRPLDDEERAVLAESGAWFEKEWRATANPPQTWGEPDYRPHERIAVRPTLELNGIGGGYAGDGFKTVLPARAIAKISCRLVPDQNPQRVYECVRDYLAKLTPPTVRGELILMEEGSPAILLDRHTPVMQAVASAYTKSYGKPPIFAREGGSVPVASVMLDELHKPMVMMPFGYKGGRAHGPNEYAVVDMFHKGIDTALYFYQELVERSRP
ncbi:MAG: M20/M25/M40 family metallo-hydrolase [Anaerolineae bacterium]